MACNVAETETPRNKEHNAQFEILIGSEEQQSPDHQVNNPKKSDDNIAVFSMQVQIHN
jgi:hypothetical protein